MSNHTKPFKIRTQRATRYNHPNQHAQYGIYNWFVNRGITDRELMKECLFVFCQEKGFEMKYFKDETKMLNWVQNRFVMFASFTVEYLTENNYDFINPKKSKH